MQTPVERRRLVPLVVTVGLSVLLFACSAGPDQPAQTARLGMARSGDDPSGEQAVPEPQAAAPPPAAVPPAVAAAPEAPVSGSPAQGAVPAAQGPVTFGSMPDQGEGQPVALTPRERPIPGSRVFSNKDLESYRRVKQEFGFRDNVLVVDASPKKGPADADDTMSAEERDRLVNETREKIDRLTQEMQYLKGRIPSLHNPFLPRAHVSDADAVDEAGMDNAERLARVTQRITALTGELGGLQKQLADLMARTPAGAPASTSGN